MLGVVLGVVRIQVALVLELEHFLVVFKEVFE